MKCVCQKVRDSIVVRLLSGMGYLVPSLQSSFSETRRMVSKGVGMPGCAVGQIRPLITLQSLMFWRPADSAGWTSVHGLCLFMTLLDGPFDDVFDGFSRAGDYIDALCTVFASPYG